MNELQTKLTQRGLTIAVYAALIIATFVVATAVWGEYGAALVFTCLAVGWLPFVIWKRVDKTIRIRFFDRPKQRVFLRAAWLMVFVWQPVIIAIAAHGLWTFSQRRAVFIRPSAQRNVDIDTAPPQGLPNMLEPRIDDIPRFLIGADAFGRSPTSHE